jgi:UDP-N-acetyl-2-amino-2-deoxyglucuronate dehydrogenase
VFTSLTDALAALDIDIVVVCTPTGRHGEVAIEALEAGKHVIIEKPAETTVAKTDQIIEAQRKAGKLVAVISQHRFDQSTEIALAAIEKGELGRLTTGIASIDWWRGQSYYDSGDWRGTWELDGGGALMNQGVHTVDLLVATMGRPVEVFAYTDTLAHQRIEVEDAAVAVVRFENGALGVLHATTAAYPGLSARLQVHGDQGSIVIDNDLLTFIHITPQGSGAEERSYGSASDSINQVDNYDLTERIGPTAGSSAGGLSPLAHRRQYENFLAALAGKEPVRVDLETNRRSIGVITGVYESARTGKPVAL